MNQGASRAGGAAGGVKLTLIFVEAGRLSIIPTPPPQHTHPGRLHHFIAGFADRAV